MVGPFGYLRSMICLVNKRAGREVATIQDFWKSKEAVFTSRRGHLIREDQRQSLPLKAYRYLSFFWSSDARKKHIAATPTRPN